MTRTAPFFRFETAPRDFRSWVYALALGLALVMPIVGYVHELQTAKVSAESGYRVSDNYKTDAYGVELATGGATSTVYRFGGEQFDLDLGMYVLRARNLSSTIGRFLSADKYEGFVEQPATVHRYAFSGSNPVNFDDPTGNSFGPIGLIQKVARLALNGFDYARFGVFVHSEVGLNFQYETGFRGNVDMPIFQILNKSPNFQGAYDRPDLVNPDTGEVYEIKSGRYYPEAVREADGDLDHYLEILKRASRRTPYASVRWHKGLEYAPSINVFALDVLLRVDRVEPGVILYYPNYSGDLVVLGFKALSSVGQISRLITGARILGTSLLKAQTASAVQLNSFGGL